MDTEAKIVEKKVYEDGKKNYATKGEALGIGIPALVLGGLAAASIWERGRGRLAGGGFPENVNINTTNGGNAGSGTAPPTAFEAWRKETDDVVELVNTIWGLKLNTQEQMYSHRETDINEKFQLWKYQVDADFGLYKTSRDLYDILNERYGAKFTELDKKVAVLEATRPYQDRLIQCEIDKAFRASINYTDRKTCRMIEGAVVLPDSPSVTGYVSYNPCRSVEG